MSFSRHDAWAIARQLGGETLNGEMAFVSSPFKDVVDHLNGLPAEQRPVAWRGFLSGRGPDREAMVRAVYEVGPDEPSPGPEEAASYATLADIAQFLSGQRWLWEGWLASGVLNVVASEPGTGKTRFAMDLARRLWFGEPWPDGQPNELPPGTKTLWVQGDRAFTEMLAAARAFGLPDEAVTLGSSREDPTGSLNLDDPETLAALAGRIQDASPAIVVIDTLGMVTGRNLCRPEEAREFFSPIMEMAGSLGVAFLGLTHLSKDKEALGRRVVEKARVVIKMTQPDPDGQPHRRRLWVDKSGAIKPPPLGITMADQGNTYDMTPPAEPDPNKPGRPPGARDKAKRFILDALADHDATQATALCQRWQDAGEAKDAFWRARNELVGSGVVTCEGRPLILRLVKPIPDEELPF